MPDEVYNLAAQSHVKISFDVPEDTADVDALGVIRILDVIKLCGMDNFEKRWKRMNHFLIKKVFEIFYGAEV